MFYSVLAAADDRRRPWADPADTPSSLYYYYTHSQDTQNHFGGAVTNNAQLQSSEIHVSFRATWDTTSLCKRLAQTDAADTGVTGL